MKKTTKKKKHMHACPHIDAFPLAPGKVTRYYLPSGKANHQLLPRRAAPPVSSLHHTGKTEEEETTSVPYSFPLSQDRTKNRAKGAAGCTKYEQRHHGTKLSLPLHSICLRLLQILPIWLPATRSRYAFCCLGGDAVIRSLPPPPTHTQGTNAGQICDHDLHALPLRRSAVHTLDPTQRATQIYLGTQWSIQRAG